MSADNCAKFGDRVSAKGDVSVGRILVGFACGFTVLGGEKVGHRLPQERAPSQLTRLASTTLLNNNISVRTFFVKESAL